jgi:hypothetical protein
MKGRDWRLASYLAIAGLLWCVAVGVLIWFLPWGSSVTTSSTGDSVTGPGESFSSISGFGPAPLLVPVALAAIATWAGLRHHRAVLIGATVLLGLYALLAGFSIGLAYVPAVIALLVACMASSATRQRSGSADSADQRTLTR